jgi:ABC-2 type transport system ATP-binding protein
MPRRSGSDTFGHLLALRASYDTPVPPIIEVRDLVKRYRGAEANAVDAISFEVASGEFFVLLGPNGAGKTTTISILTTTLAPTAGTVRIAGFDVDRESSRVRREVGIIFQKPSLDLNLTAEENVRFHAVLYGLYPFRPSYRLMPRAYKRQVEELAAVLGVERELFQPIKTFSGGMSRKLEIIRSLVHRPRVLFPTSRRSGSTRPALATSGSTSAGSGPRAARPSS